MWNISYTFKGHLSFFVDEMSIHIFYFFFFFIFFTSFSTRYFPPWFSLRKLWTNHKLRQRLKTQHRDLTFLNHFRVSCWPGPMTLHFTVYFPRRHPSYHNTTTEIRKVSTECPLLKQKNSVQDRWLHLLISSFFSSAVLDSHSRDSTEGSRAGQLFWRRFLISVCLILPEV